MTDWRTVYSDINNKPALVDTDSSVTTVYLRRNLEQVEVEDDMGEEKTTRQMWKYEERTCTHEEYNVAILSTEMVTLKHDTDVIDEYTAMLLEEGLL